MWFEFIHYWVYEVSAAWQRSPWTMRRLPGTEGNDLQWRYQTHGQEMTSTHSLNWVLENNNSGSKGYSQTHIGKTKRLYYRPRKLVRLGSLRELDPAKRLGWSLSARHPASPATTPVLAGSLCLPIFGFVHQTWYLFMKILNGMCY